MYTPCNHRVLLLPRSFPIRSTCGPATSNYYADFYHHRLVSPVLELHINEAIQYVPYSMYHTEARLKSMILGIHLIVLTVVYCFLLWSGFVLYACNTTILSILLLMAFGLFPV